MDKEPTVQQNASPVMTQTFNPTINIHPALAPAANDAEPNWEIRYPGGLADVSMVRGEDERLHRFAIAKDFTFINNSPHQVSVRVTFLIIYGSTQLATDPYALPLPEWAQLLTAFGIATKPQLQFPLNLPPRSAVDGHIVFSVAPEGAGRGIGGDIPENRQYLFEFEDLLEKRKVAVGASAVFAPDKNHHQRCSKTDLARPGPGEEPFIAASIDRDRISSSDLVSEDGMLWRLSNNKRDGPYCPACYEAEGKAISLIEGATRGVFSCPIHRTQFWTKGFRDRASRGFRP